jgi:hypothetical protein
VKWIKGFSPDHWLAAVDDGFYQVTPVGGTSTEWQLAFIRYHAVLEPLGTHYDKQDAMKRAVEHYGN